MGDLHYHFAVPVDYIYACEVKVKKQDDRPPSTKI